MTHVRPGHLVILCTTLFVLAFGSACGDRHTEGDHFVRFVQLTDPHVFLDTSKDSDPAKKAAREKQEKLDQSAVSDFWKQVPSLGGDQAISFLVITGDLGVEPCSFIEIPATMKPEELPKAKECIEKANTVNKDKRASQITVLADLFGGSPVRDIYLAAGNNDIATEVASDDGLDYFDQFIADLQKKIDDSKKNVQLHNLTGCYSGKGGSCYADVAETSYRLIGFPSYSFKNRETGSDANTTLQEKQFDTFSGLLDQARQAGKKVLVVSHIPLIDDPYTLAQDRYAGAAPPAAIDKDPKNTRSAWSTWNVSKKVSDEWQEAIASDAVAGVLAGHLHDSHKEIYRQPYTWSSVNDQKTGFSKLYMAPPLSVKNQDTSPIQARGFSLVGLGPEGIKYKIYWYNAEKGDFAPDQREEYAKRESHRRGSIGRAIGDGVEKIVLCVWEFLCPKTLDDSAILMIALLAAFLTVVQIWQIPPPDATVKSSSTQASSGGTQSGAGQTPDAKAAFSPSPFASNFGQTIITGLGGLAAETVLKSLDGKPTPNDKYYYIVWFVILLFLLMISLSLFRAFVEAIRSRIAIIHYPLARRPRVIWAEGPSGSPNNNASNDARKLQEPNIYWDTFKYWVLRIVHWFFSLKVQLLTFLDTFINLIQGKNQTNTRVFGDIIIDQQRNLVRVAHAIRRHLHEVLLQQLFKEENRRIQAKDAPEIQAKDKPALFEHKVTPQVFRVNISVLSADQTKVFYIARSPGSSVLPFPKRSVAWVSVVTGRIRWYKKAYKDILNKIVLFDNSSGILADQEKTIYMQSNYQSRDDDYDAFVVFPVPYPLRGYGTNYVKGAIQISFRHQEHFAGIWPIDPDPLLKPDPLLPNEERGFSSEGKMLDEWCPDPEIRESLREAIAVLGELLRGFNENIYLSYPEGNEGDA